MLTVDLEKEKEVTEINIFIYLQILQACSRAQTILMTVLEYRGFERKGARLLGHNIIVVANQRYGLKRCSGMLGSILDLNVGSLQ